MSNKWSQQYPTNNFTFASLPYDPSWAPMMNKINNDTNIKKSITKLETMINRTIKETKVYPYPDEVLNAFNVTKLDDIKVVIIGQDPYYNSVVIMDDDVDEDKEIEPIPQAMGLSFSVKNKVKIPPSLVNIFANLYRNKLIPKIPSHGDLTKWAQQGCLLLNTSLTVPTGKPNAHKAYWKPITNEMIKYVSDNTNNIVFMLWGGEALDKLSLIDQQKHKVTISSHPSPMSIKTPLGIHDTFYNSNHFKVANDYLASCGKAIIDWNV